MAKIAVQQTSFASGELSPGIFGRIDRDIYANGADKARNVWVTPLGGVLRRYGSKYLDNTTSNLACRFISFAFNTEQAYLIVFTPGEFKVYKEGVLQTTVTSSPISTITAAMVTELNWTQSADTLIIVHKDLPPIRITRTSDTAWTAVNITLSNIPQYDFGSGNEDVWSATRGWPKSATFWQQRLWFGGSGSRPQTVWASKIAGFFDFNVGTGAAADAIDFTIDDDQVNAIVNIFAGRTLQVFTTGGEFFTPISLNSAITAATVSLERATRHGSSPVRPISSDGATIFADKAGAIIREYVFLDVEQSYITTDISFLSEHLIQSPVCAALQSSNALSGEYSYWVNSDGTMAVLNRRRAQNFLAWTLWETEGEYEQVAIVDDEVYVSVKRVIDGATVRFIEKFDVAYYTDAGTIYTDTAKKVWPGITYLEGENVNVRSQEGYPLLANVVTSGEITTESNQTGIEVGLPWTPRIRTMPPQMGFSNGSNLIGQKRRILSVLFNLIESNGFNMSTQSNSFRVSLNTIGDVTFNQVNPKFTGWKKMFNRGYSREPYIEVTQTDPNDLHILSLSTEVTT